MRSFVLGLIIAAAFPAGASAMGRPLVPQGNSGADQYVESLPTAGGSVPAHSARPIRARSPVTSGSLTPAVQGALEHQGAAGRQTAALAGAYAPARRRQVRRHTSAAGGSSSGGGTSSGGSSTGSGPAGAGASGSAAASVPSTAGLLARSLTGLSSPAGLGGGLLVVLLLAALGAGGLGLARRRRAA